jgi:hypothetical protein
MKSLKTTKFDENWLSIILVIIVALITYAPYLSQLGFYRDDWYLIWTAQTQGADGIRSLFRGDRPFLGWLYVFDYNLLGSSPLNWHIYALVLKMIGAFGFLWLLRSLWPDKKIETTFLTLLFLVYPGFYQQPNAATFKNLLLAYASAMFSLALTIQALRAGLLTAKIVLTISAVALAAVYIFIYEALVGIEVARLLFIWYFLQERGLRDWKITVRKTLVEAWPYLLFAAGFVFWRIFLFESTRRATNVDVVFSQYASLSVHNLARLVIETARDVIESTFLAWSVPYYQFTVQSAYSPMGLAGFLGLLAVGAAGAYYFLVRDPATTESKVDPTPRVAWDWMVLGGIITVVTTIPIVMSGRNVLFGIQWDRYTYQSLLGVALVIGGLVFYTLRGRSRWIALSILIIAGVVTQFFSADYYRSLWKLERNAVWQILWRAPQIQDGTNLVIALPQGYQLAEEYEVWGPVNLAYHPADSLKLTGQVMFSSIWVDMARGTQEERLVRGTVPVLRDYGKTIVASQPSTQSCLHLLDGQRAEQAISEPFDVQVAARYSKIELIDISAVPVVPPENIFGPEPDHDWCYYFQKMDLARQQMDWQTVANLAEEARSLGLSPNDFSEWLPALEAYIHLGDQKHTKQIATFIRVNKPMHLGLCTQMRSLEATPAGYDRALLFEALCIRD